MLRQHGQAGPYGNPSLNCLPDGVPHADLLPEPFKIIQTPGVIVMLYEVETIFRQVFTDGRKQLVDPSPAWLGYSVGKWEGDTLVVDTRGFNDRSWLDARGHGHTEDMRVEERFERRDFGHLDVAWRICLRRLRGMCFVLVDAVAGRSSREEISSKLFVSISTIQVAKTRAAACDSSAFITQVCSQCRRLFYGRLVAPMREAVAERMADLLWQIPRA